MMDLFRHRSQSAVSADDKRKAVSLQQLLINYNNTYQTYIKYILKYI